MERLSSLRDRLSTLLLCSARMFHVRLAGSNRPLIRVPIAVDQQLKRWQDAGVCNVLMDGDLVE